MTENHAPAQQHWRRGYLPRSGWRVDLILGLAAVALTACSSVPDALNPVEWYKGAEEAVLGGDDDEATGTETTGEGQRAAADMPGEDRPFPNLADVPERPETRTPAEITQLTEGLVADRARSRYSQDSVPLQGMSSQSRPSLGGSTDTIPSMLPDGVPNGAGAGSLEDPAVERASAASVQRLVPFRPGAAPRPAAGAPAPEGLVQSVPPPPSAVPPPRTAPPAVAFSDAPPPARGGPPPSPPGMSREPPPPPTFSDAPPPAPPPPAAAPEAGRDALASSPPPAPPLTAPPPPTLSEPGGGPGAATGDAASGRPAVALPPEPGVAATAEQAEAGADRQQAAAAGRRRIATIPFGDGSAQLGDRERDVLRQVVELHKEEGGTIRIVGRSSGPDEAGTSAEDISRRRAIAVAEELVRLGVDREQLQLAARPQPRVDSSAGETRRDEAGQAAERRAEIFFVN